MRKAYLMIWSTIIVFCFLTILAVADEGYKEIMPRAMLAVQLFGMALRSQHEAFVGHFDQFHDTIAGTATDTHAFAGVLDALVMQAVRLHLLPPQNALHLTACLHVDFVDDGVAWHFPIGMEQAILHLTCQVLMEAATEGHIH